MRRSRQWSELPDRECETMPFETIDIKQSETCEVHGTPSRAAHRTLWGMVAASLLLIVWHVWVRSETMPFETIDIKQSETCEVHGTPSRAAHRTLWGMVAASLLLIVWHVWV